MRLEMLDEMQIEILVKAQLTVQMSRLKRDVR